MKETSRNNVNALGFLRH